MALLAVLLSGLLGLQGCATLPHYARPRLFSELPGEVSSGDGFSYRQLAAADFQAPYLEGDLAAYRDRINARSCLTIRPDKTVKMAIWRNAYHGTTFFVGRLSEVSYTAVFIPACSWWKPGMASQQVAYVLQHEQIHFGLATLTARRLTREAGRDFDDYRAFGSSYREVQEQLAAAVRERAQGAIVEDLDNHLQFDEDTSMVFRQDLQQQWYERIEKELQEL